MPIRTLFIFSTVIYITCSDHPGSSLSKNFISSTAFVNQPEDNPYVHIKNIPLPDGFVREHVFNDSFADYLRNIGLKKDRTVYLFSRNPKINQSAQFAVLNISVGNSNLQQCADAVMRLRAEYLFKQGSFDKIIFFDNDKTVYKFCRPYTRDNFKAYLNKVFGMCGTASLSKQLKPVADFYDIQPGAVLIRGGFPGHAAIVMDVAVNESGKKIYLLAQSYMPAQDIHILNNPMNKNLSPWYEVNTDTIIRTPEYTFTKKELRSW